MPDQPAPDLSKSEKQRQIRVFVSSTFRDMHEERNYLVKHIFPKLRKLCEERGVTWGEVDLRWGINDEQKAEGKVLPICLEEIKRCKPYFIGLLGERYGWVPDTIPQELIDRESWLKEHIGKSGKSVTELEILHGVLNNPDMAEHAFFYFRDPAYIPDKQKDFTAEDAEGAEKAKKLKGLKERIRKSGFPVHENYPNPKALGDFIYKDLEGVVNTLYPKGSEPAPLDRDAMDHDAFAQSRAKVYFGRKAYFDRLDEHVNGDGPPLVILGESGSGKSALLANWALQYRENHRASLPHQKTTPQFPPSQGGDKGEVKLKDDLVPPSQGGEEKGDKEHTSDQKVQFQQSLRAKAKQSISEMPDDQGIASVAHPSQGGGFITSDQPNDRGEGELIIMHFIGATPYSADWMAMLRRIMGEFKRLLGIQGDIPDKPDSLRMAFANWLSMAAAKGRVILILDALNQLEDRDGAPDLLWLPPVLPANIRLIVSTLPAKDFTAEGTEKLIGLKEQTRSRPLEELKKRDWYTLTVEPFNQSERKVFIKDYLKQYTKELDTEQTERIAAAQQTSNPLYLRALLEELRLFGKYEELDEKITYYLEAQNPYELYTKVLIRWEEAYEGDSDLVGDSMSLIWASRRGIIEHQILDILGETASIVWEPPKEMGNELLDLRKDRKQLPMSKWSPLFLAVEESLINCSGFFNFSSVYLRDAVRNVYVPTEELQKEIHLRLAYYFKWQSVGTQRHNEIPWQLMKAKEWQKLVEWLVGPECLRFAYCYAWPTYKYDVILYWTTIEENTCLSRVDVFHDLIYKPGKYDIDLVKTVHDLLRNSKHSKEFQLLQNYLINHYKQVGDNRSLQYLICEQAYLYKMQGDYGKAISLLKESECISRELGDKEGLAACLGTQALIYNNKGIHDEAMELHKEEELLFRELGNKRGLAVSIRNQMNIVLKQGKYDEAERLCKEAIFLFKILNDKNAIAACIDGYASILSESGKYEEAIIHHKEAECIFREIGDKRGLAISLSNQSIIYFHHRKEPDEAMRLCKEAECIFRTLNDIVGLVECLVKQAANSILIDNQPHISSSLTEEAYQLATKHGLDALAQQIKALLDVANNANRNANKMEDKKRPELSPDGKLICPVCKLKCEKGSTFCIWCKSPFK